MELEEGQSVKVVKEEAINKVKQNNETSGETVSDNDLAVLENTSITLDKEIVEPVDTQALLEEAQKADSTEAEIQSLQGKIENLTAHLDKMYMDRLSGLLSDSDFERIYKRVKMDRTALEEKLKQLEAQKESPVSTEDRARELVQQYLASACNSRELLVSLIERVELTEDKQIIIKFRFRELAEIS